MSQYTTIKNLLYETIHRGKKPVEQIADEMGISANYLYRAGMPLDGSGVKFPLEYLVPLMKTTRNYKILKHLARLCGFILVREPRFRGYKGDEIDLVDDYQHTATKAVHALKLFLNEPTLANYKRTNEALNEVLEQSAKAQRYCTKKISGQLELDL